MDLDPTKKLRSINPTQQEEPLFIETLPPEIWWSILDYLTNRHDLENLRRESRDFAWLIQDYLNNKEQKLRSEEHTSELQSLMRISYAVFCLTKKKKKQY